MAQHAPSPGHAVIAPVKSRTPTCGESMPIVTMRWGANERPTVAPNSLVEFLRNEAGFDSAEALESAQDLTHGKTVEAYFDLGEGEAATAFARKLAAWGLEAHIQSDKEIEKTDRTNWLKNWAGLAFFFGIAVIGAIIQEPWYETVLLLLALGGIVCFLFIRFRNGKSSS